MSRCPSKRTLLASLGETVPSEAVRHITTCVTCATRRTTLKRDLSMIRATLMTVTVPDASAARRRARRMPAIAAAAAAMAAVSIVWLVYGTGDGTPPVTPARVETERRVDTDRLLVTLSASMFDSGTGMTAVWGPQTQMTQGPDGCEWGLVVRCTDTLTGRGPELGLAGFGTN